MKPYFLLGTLFLILVGALLKTSTINRWSKPMLGRTKLASSGISLSTWMGVPQNTELVIKMQCLSSSEMVSSHSHTPGEGRQECFTYPYDSHDYKKLDNLNAPHTVEEFLSKLRFICTCDLSAFFKKRCSQESLEQSELLTRNIPPEFIKWKFKCFKVKDIKEYVKSGMVLSGWWGCGWFLTFQVWSHRVLRAGFRDVHLAHGRGIWDTPVCELAVLTKCQQHPLSPSQPKMSPYLLDIQ